MAAPPGLEDLGSAQGGPLDAAAFEAALAAWCEPLRLRCSRSFLISWYNETRAETAAGLQCLTAPAGAVGFLIYSVPGYVDTVVEHFARRRPRDHVVDACTDELLGELQARLRPELGAWAVNTDKGPPYYHVQTLGCIAGVDQHLQAQDVGDAEWADELGPELEEMRDPKMWGTDPEQLRKVFSVNMHPKWGGWYAYRGLLVLPNAGVEGLPRPESPRFLPPAEYKRILEEYNLRHQECRWRDLSEEGHPPGDQYSPGEFLFWVETSAAKRRRFLEIRAAQLVLEGGTEQARGPQATLSRPLASAGGRNWVETLSSSSGGPSSPAAPQFARP